MSKIWGLRYQILCVLLGFLVIDESRVFLARQSGANVPSPPPSGKLYWTDNGVSKVAEVKMSEIRDKLWRDGNTLSAIEMTGTIYREEIASTQRWSVKAMKWVVATLCELPSIGRSGLRVETNDP